jgi:hypothetical protein
MLGETARREIRAVQDAFVTIGRPIPSDRTLESSILTIGSFSTDVQQSISNFIGIRRALSGILQGAEPDMAAMSLALEETAPTEIIRMMVEQTSISLDPLFRMEAREGM